MTPPTPKVVEKVVVQKSEDSTKVKALEDELAVAARKLSELKTDSRAEFESAKKKIREEYEAELKILQSKVASLEKALSRSDEIAKEKLAMATKAAQAEKDRMEKTLRAEITAAKSLAANAKLSAQRELSSVLRGVKHERSGICVSKPSAPRMNAPPRRLKFVRTPKRRTKSSRTRFPNSRRCSTSATWRLKPSSTRNSTSWLSISAKRWKFSKSRCARRKTLEWSIGAQGD